MESPRGKASQESPARMYEHTHVHTYACTYSTHNTYVPCVDLYESATSYEPGGGMLVTMDGGSYSLREVEAKLAEALCHEVVAGWSPPWA